VPSSLNSIAHGTSPDKVKRRKEGTMSNLIQCFKEDLQLAGYAKRSIDSYASSVLRLQRFYNKPLENISEEQLRQYWLYCQSEFGWRGRVALINEVFTGATCKTKFARASHDIVFIESTHIFPSYHDALERFQSEAVLSKFLLRDFL
jgi:hypothetical protein